VVDDSIPPSLLFTPEEVTVIQRAMAGFNAALPGTEDGEDGEDGEDEDEEGVDPRAHRKIKLSGISYISPEVWTVWINEMRILPGYLPPEIVSINVKKDRVLLEWYDRVTDTIITLTLRPHQVYDMDTGIILPG